MAPKRKPVQSLDTLRTIEGLKTKASEVIESKSHANHLLDILNSLESQDSEISDASQRSLTRIFDHFLVTKTMAEEAVEGQAMTEFKNWARDCYSQTKQGFINIMTTSESTVSQELALVNSMKLLATEGKYPMEPVSETSPYFPSKSLLDIVEAIITPPRAMDLLISRYQEYIEYHDVKYHTLKALHSILKQRREDIASGDVDPDDETFTSNTFNMLSSIQFPILGKKPKKKKKMNGKQRPQAHFGIDTDLLCDPVIVDMPRFELNYEKAADLFASVWLLFLSFKIPVKLYRNILIGLDDNVMPHFRNPLSLSDFLIDSFSVGGSVSLLALSSLFILIQKCNLEYPDFYSKVYSMLEPNILWVKYRSKFFYWTDIFLSSTHLPIYLVAAFVKKLSRLALTAPTEALLVMIPLIGNLLVRHKGLAELLNRPEVATLSEDPFLDKELDPSQCQAVDSSLWELKTLQNHWHPRVSSAACFIQRTLPTQEWDLAEVLDMKAPDLVEAAFASLKKDETPVVDTSVRDFVSRHLFENGLN
jgi:U3 small nucleolar RNA-associated protein 19